MQSAMAARAKARITLFITILPVDALKPIAVLF
jgi:hypothetical protein